MSEHKLEYGKQIIQRLLRLGGILGYHAEKEMSIRETRNSAVDVAWFFERGQEYPLFIFEIESRTTNSIVANPLKVFGESNEEFEKPLFFFHLLLTGGQDSAKISQLQQVFGSHNYRVYRFKLDEDLQLLKDVLSQHRRLSNSLDIVSFLKEILTSWKRTDVSDLTRHIEDLGFQKARCGILPAYAELYKSYPSFKEEFLSFLKKEGSDLGRLLNAAEYDSYLGQEWATPIHLGLLSAFFDSPTDSNFFEKFKEWQESSSYLKMIGPFFGLSRDYDFFLLGMSGAVFGLLSALFYKPSEARLYFANELFQIIKEAEVRFPAEFSLINALWLLHICPISNDGDLLYAYGQKFINENGGIPTLIFENPLVEYYGFIEEDDFFEDYGDLVQIPCREEFLARKGVVKPDNDRLFNLSISYLTDPNGNWSPISAEQL